MKEEWRPVKNYESLYEVSNFGKVRSIINNNKKIKKLSKHRSGYFYTSLSKNSITYTAFVHQLVWDSFGNKPRNGRKLQIDHIDNNKLNNRIDNLQLLTQRENISKGFCNKKTSSKYTGVVWNNRAKKWYSRIIINGKSKYLGIFNSEYDAHLAYQKALIGII